MVIIDNYTLLCIWRAILDAFWSRETSTVSGNFRRLRRDYFDSAEALSIRRPVPIIGTNKVRDIFGMGCAIQNLDASRRKGKWQDQLQWYLVRQTPTWYKNAWEAGAGYLEAGAIYLENEKMCMSPLLPLQADGSQCSFWVKIGEWYW